MRNGDQDKQPRYVPTVETEIVRHAQEAAEQGEVITQVDSYAHKHLVLNELPPEVRGRLTFLNGPEKGRVVVLDQAYTALGRHPQNDMVISCPTVSGRHAAIYFTASFEWRIEDLGSKNGTLLNGSAVKGFALRSGDKIFIGDTLMLFTAERP